MSAHAVAGERRMPLVGHLREARSRAIVAAVAVVIACGAGYALSDAALDVLRAPIETLAEDRVASLNYDSITGAFDVRLKVALVVGIVLSSPVWAYELLAFLLPGLTRRERMHVLVFAPVAAVLFVAGCATGLAIFPHMVELLAGFADAEDSTLLQASTYVDFVLKVVVAAGIAFLLPVVLVMLNVAGVLAASTIARGWRIWTIAIVLFSAMVTPAADVLSMVLIAVPMLVLFVAAWFVAWLHDRAVRRRDRDESRAGSVRVQEA